ncbi:hypothetical protein [Nocardia sp. XZ_19_385]|uniref:hypothetical protein n=1 Tax=Nocardia sp. XZ_19_385 TaxID=2769488 RepID=UPI00188E4B51|nr:hypothetical protein [Nocardia sp. XZ_19_385]
MAITEMEWLITSDVALEVAFRVDLPEPGRGGWVLSYLPTSLRFTREQALSGIVLAEMILLEQLSPAQPLDREVAQLRAAELGVTLLDVMCVLALRACTGCREISRAAAEVTRRLTETSGAGR